MTFVIIISFLYLIFFQKLTFQTRLNPLTIPLFFWFVSFVLSSWNLMYIDPVSNYGYFFLLLFIFIIHYSSLYFNRKPFETLGLNNNTFIDDYSYWIFIAASASICFNFFYMVQYSGGILNFFLNASALYHERIDGELVAPIPYLSSFIYISCVHFGGQLAQKKTLSTFTMVVLCLLMTLIDSLLSFGRANFLIGILLIFFSILFRRYQLHNYKFKVSARLLSLLSISLFTVLFLLVAIRDTRGGLENFYFKKDAPQIVTQLEEVGLFRPSLYFYFVSPLAVFDNSLDHRFLNDMPMGYETFSPIYRPVLRLVGYEKITYYEEFINIGEKMSNVGTMFKDVYVDFGLWGIPFFCISIGFIIQFTYRLWIHKSNLYLISFISTYLFMGGIMNLFRLGQFLIPLIIVAVFTFLPKINIK